MAKTTPQQETKLGFIKRLTRHIYFKNAVAALILFLSLGWIILLILNFYTHHSDSTEVPDLMGMSFDEAESRLERAGLRAMLIDSVYFRDKKSGSVVQFEPVSGTHVKPNRIIFITTNANSRPSITLPALVDLSIHSAQSRIRSLELEIGAINYVDHEFKDLVLEATYRGKQVYPGMKVPDGAKIDFVVGSGEMESPPEQQTEE